MYSNIPNQKLIKKGRYAGVEPAVRTRKDYHSYNSSSAGWYNKAWKELLVARFNGSSATNARKEIVVGGDSRATNDQRIGGRTWRDLPHRATNAADSYTVTRHGHLFSLYAQRSGSKTKLVTVDTRDLTLEFGAGLDTMLERYRDTYYGNGGETYHQTAASFIGAVLEVFVAPAMGEVDADGDWDGVTPHSGFMGYCKQLDCPVQALADSEGRVWYYEAKANGRRLTHDQFWSIVRVETTAADSIWRSYDMLALDGIRVQRVGYSNSERGAPHHLLADYIGVIRRVFQYFEPDEDGKVDDLDDDHHWVSNNKLPQGIYNAQVSKNSPQVVLRSPVEVALDLLEKQMLPLMLAHSGPGKSAKPAAKAYSNISHKLTLLERAANHNALNYATVNPEQELLGKMVEAAEHALASPLPSKVNGGIEVDYDPIALTHEATSRLRQTKKKPTCIFERVKLPLKTENRRW